MATVQRWGSHGNGEGPWPPRVRALAATLVVVVTAWLLGATSAVGEALAHTGHDHPAAAGGGGVLLPAVLLLGSVAVLGTSVYLDRAGEIEGWLGRAGVLLGIGGLLVGWLLALF